MRHRRTRLRSDAWYLLFTCDLYWRWAKFQVCGSCEFLIQLLRLTSTSICSLYNGECCIHSSAREKKQPESENKGFLFKPRLNVKSENWRQRKETRNTNKIIFSVLGSIWRERERERKKSRKWSFDIKVRFPCTPCMLIPAFSLKVISFSPFPYFPMYSSLFQNSSLPYHTHKLPHRSLDDIKPLAANKSDKRDKLTQSRYIDSYDFLFCWKIITPPCSAHSLQLGNLEHDVDVVLTYLHTWILLDA